MNYILLGSSLALALSGVTYLQYKWQSIFALVTATIGYSVSIYNLCGTNPYCG